MNKNIKPLKELFRFIYVLQHRDEKTLENKENQ